MRTVFFCCLWALLLALLTIGLGFLGLYLDPWDGEVGGNNPLIFFAFPFLICFIASTVYKHGFAMIIGGLIGLFVQFCICLVVVASVRAFLALFRKFR